MEKMPKKGIYTFLLILNFVLGIIWGLLSLAPYRRMSNALAENEPYGAWEGAKKIRMFTIFAVFINVLIAVFSILNALSA